jgi:hypothetical protein
MQRIIGVDFDNTIVCYDETFYAAAVEKKLIPPETPKNKESVRNYLRKIGQEPVWTELQGYVYGVKMREVTPYPGVIDFFISAVRNEIPVCIISHKTLFPYAGPGYNLHKAAYDWLDSQRFFDPGYIGLDPKKVFFELSMNEKLNRISNMQCTHFIDDLPELFSKAAFPINVNKILFNPNREDSKPIDSADYLIFPTWQDISRHLLSK